MIVLTAAPSRDEPDAIVLLLVMGLCLSVALESVGWVLEKSRLTEVFGFASVVKVEQALHYAHQGHWAEHLDREVLIQAVSGSAADAKSTPAISTLIQEIFLTPQGSFHFQLQAKDSALAGRVLSFTRAHTPAGAFYPLRWTCNGSNADQFLEHQTTVPAAYWPYPCRVFADTATQFLQES